MQSQTDKRDSGKDSDKKINDKILDAHVSYGEVLRQAFHFTEDNKYTFSPPYIAVQSSFLTLFTWFVVNI